jgi:hypothetical protein
VKQFILAVIFCFVCAFSAMATQPSGNGDASATATATGGQATAIGYGGTAYGGQGGEGGNAAALAIGGQGGSATIQKGAVAVTNEVSTRIDNKNTNTNVNLNDLSNKNSNTNFNVNAQDQKQSQSQKQAQIQGQKQSTTVTGNTNNVAQSVTNPNTNTISINNPDIPTQYPGFVGAPTVTQPWLQFDMSKFVANTASSLWTHKTWQYEAIGQWDVPKGAKAANEVLGTGAGYKEVVIYKNRTELPAGKTIVLLEAGVVEATDGGVYRTQMEKWILTEAKARKANAIIEVAVSASIESKQKTFNAGIGMGGTAVERFGSLAGSLGLGLGYASATGNGIPKPFVAYEIIELK